MQEYSELNWQCQVIAALGIVAEEFYPCDQTDFLEKAELVRANFCMTVLIAMLKEPSATSLFLESVGNGDYSNPDVALDGCRSVARNIARAPTYHHESVQLAVGGACRWTGTVAVLGKLGVIRRLHPRRRKRTRAESQGDADAESQRTRAESQGDADAESQGDGDDGAFPCGAMLTEYVQCEASSTFHGWWTRTAALQDEWEALFQDETITAQGVSELARRVLRLCELGKFGRFFQNSEKGYVHKFVARKLFLSVFQARTRLGWSVQWDSIPSDCFSELCPDQHGVTRCVPETWTAADASNFLLGRPDRLVFLSMWGCLWTSAAGDSKRMRKRISNWVRDGQFLATWRRLRETWGVTPHPAKVAEALEEEGA